MLKWYQNRNGTIVQWYGSGNFILIPTVCKYSFGSSVWFEKMFRSYGMIDLPALASDVTTVIPSSFNGKGIQTCIEGLRPIKPFAATSLPGFSSFLSYSTYGNSLRFMQSVTFNSPTLWQHDHKGKASRLHTINIHAQIVSSTSFLWIRGV